MKTYLEPKEIEQMEQAAEYLRDKLLVRLLFRHKRSQYPRFSYLGIIAQIVED